MASRGPLDFAGVTLSSRRVYGEEATWAGLEKALAPYSLEQIVIVICRISVSLYNQTAMGTSPYPNVGTLFTNYTKHCISTVIGDVHWIIGLQVCYENLMLRKARIDAPGALHHIIVRGIKD